jgi:ParB family chromosome partitioning protein
MARKKLSAVMNDATAAALADGQKKEAAGSNRYQKRMSLVGDVSEGRVSTKQRREVDPKRCRMWQHHNRLYDQLSSTTCGDLIADIESANGQKIPAIVRELDGADGYDFEVIAGARRHYSVSYLREEKGRDDILFLIEVHNLSDEEAFRLSDLENRNREDISDYERALDYKGALQRYYGGDVRKMAKALGVGEGYLRNFEALASLSDEVLEVVPNRLELTKNQAKAIKPLWSDQQAQQRMRSQIKEIRKEQESIEAVGRAKVHRTDEVIKRLIKAAQSKAASSETVELGTIGEKQVVADVNRRSVTVKIPRGKGFDAEAFLEDLKKLIASH